jgi:hypothetical protein
MRKSTIPVSLMILAGVALTGCVRGSAGPVGPPLALDPGPGSPVTGPPPSPSPAPAPTPTPSPSPPPPGAPLPPLAPVPVDLDDNHQVGSPYWPDGDTATGAHGEVIGPYECFPTAPPETYHVHSHLSIFLDGAGLAVPKNIGIIKLNPTTTCYYTLHTHDRSGKLHIEAATPAMFTLGDLFRIWGEPLEHDNVAGLTGKPIVIFITDNNGVVTEATGDWHDIELLSHREITIQVGTPIAEIPNFTWTAH